MKRTINDECVENSPREISNNIGIIITNGTSTK
jgi:hypothetical protein